MESGLAHPRPEDVALRRRLDALEHLRLLDRLGDPVLTSLTRLAQFVTGAGAAAVHIFDAQYQRRIAAVGAPLVDHPERDSMCRIVVRENTRIVTRDATLEERFAYSSFVTNPTAPVRFYASVPLRVGGGVAVGTLCAFSTETQDLSDEQIAMLEEIAELARAHLELVRISEELGDAARHDPLTGAVNRAIFDDRLALALARRRRHGTSVLVAMIDLDDFKALNDAYGHEIGDRALRWTSERLKASLRADDTVGRLGGDEFAVIAEIKPDVEEVVVSRLRAVAEGFSPAFTVSVGTVLAEDDDDVQTVLRRADQAMYAVKAQRG